MPKYFLLALMLLGSLTIGSQTMALTVPSYAHYFKDIQGTTSKISSDTGTGGVSSWSQLTGSSIGGTKPSSYSVVQNLSAPAHDSDADTAKFYNAGSSGGYADVMWTRQLGSNLATNFVMDMYIYIDKPSNTNAIEIAVNKVEGSKWEKLSTQCNYRTGAFNGYDPVYKKWVYLGVPCKKAAAKTWQHIRFEWQIKSGNPYFVAVTFGSTRYSIGKTLHPQSLSSSSEAMSVHIQTDTIGASYAGFSTYVDTWNLYYW